MFIRTLGKFVLSISVSIIEDNPQFRAYIGELISSSNRCELVGSACSGAEAMQLIAQDKTDVYLVDLGLPDADGVDVIARIKSACPTARSMVLSTFGDAKHIDRSILAGASGYLLKDDSHAGLIDKIVSLNNGEAPFSPSLIKILFQRLSKQQTKTENSQNFTQYSLTARELEILHFLVLGLTIFNIGVELSISSHTVNQHLRAVYRKLDVRSRAMAVSKAIQNGFLDI